MTHMAGEWNGTPCWAHNPSDTQFDSGARHLLQHRNTNTKGAAEGVGV